MTIALDVLGIGVVGPGMPDWATAAALLREPDHWQPVPTVIPAPQRLPATERRRAGPVVRLSVAVADAACGAAGADPAQLATVFTSSSGEPGNCHALCEALAAPQRLVSPTRFTNSVHNAAGGYWHIATRSMAPSTSLSAWDASFGAGLLEAAVQCHASGAPVLLVAADVTYPAPLQALRPLADAFGVALLLAPGRSLALACGGSTAPTPCAHAGLDALRRGVPAARALPLLQALASGAPAALVLDAAEGTSLTLALAAADGTAPAPLTA